MPICSALVIIATLYGFVRKTKLKEMHNYFLLMYTVLLLYWPQGYFVALGNYKLSNVVTFSELILFIVSLFILVRIKVCSRLLFLGCVFFLLILIGSLYEYLNPVNFQIINDYADWDYYAYGRIGKETININIKEQIILYIQVINYIINVFIVKTIYSKDDIYNLLQKIVLWSAFVIGTGILEFTIKNIIHYQDVYYMIKEIFFGISEKTVIEPVVRGSFYSLEGMTTEPSHYTCTIFISLMLAAILKKINAMKTEVVQKSSLLNFMTKKTYFIIGLITMYLTGGLSGILYIVMAIIGYSIISSGHYEKLYLRLKKYLIYSIVSVLACWGILYVLYNYGEGYVKYRMDISVSVIEMLISGNYYLFGVVDSSVPRFIANMDVFLDFMKRPLLGLGIGVQTAFNEFSTMFSYFGILGVAAWLLFINQIGKNNYDILKLHYDKIFLIFIFFIAGFFAGETHMMLPMINVLYFLLYESTKLYSYK